MDPVYNRGDGSIGDVFLNMKTNDGSIIGEWWNNGVALNNCMHVEK